MKADIGGIYASFLPGVSVTLCKIITGDTKQGYAVTAVSYPFEAILLSLTEIAHIILKFKIRFILTVDG